MARHRGQVAVVFAGLVVVLLGILGLAIDGGYYWAASRGVTIAADSAARAAAADVQRAQGGGGAGFYSRATSDGRAIGQANLAQLRLTGTNVRIEYNNTPNATPNSAGWSAGPPTGSTRSVQATIDGNYSTLFLGVVGLPTLSLQRAGQGTPIQSGVTLQRPLPFGVCSLTITLSPNGPWRIWDKNGSLCLVLGWHGLVNLDNQPAPTCNTYITWIGPPVQGPPPNIGANATLDAQTCGSTIGNAAQQWNGTTQLIPEINTVAGLLGNTYVACRLVQINADGSKVEGTPQGGRVPCVMEQNY